MSKRAKGIADELRRAIGRAHRRGVTKYRIAKATGLPQSTVGRVASGETVPNLETAERIAKAIGCRLAVIPIVASAVVVR